ncbi:MAG: PEP-CTERM sorting domain-containing protein [Planctomycetes bacterium]|nr:PEP-CTERM sorting domain-containing protein [Planctomycetota bacterium]
MVAHRESGGVVRRGRVVLSIVAIVLMFAANGAMAYVAGTNDILEQTQGRAFVPLKGETSGVLGDVQGGRTIGLAGDTITLRNGQVSQGSLTYDLLFDLSDNFEDGAPVVVDPAAVRTDTMDLFLDLTDIDFVPETNAGRSYSESLTLRLFAAGREVELTNGEGAFRIDATNYGNYRGVEGPDFGPTNNVQVRYSINLESDLGLSAADFAQILGDMSFILEVTVTSTTLRTAPGTGTYRNSPEYLGDYSADDGVGGDPSRGNGLGFELTVIPEPMTASLLALGSVGLLLRRRR